MAETTHGGEVVGDGDGHQQHAQRRGEARGDQRQQRQRRGAVGGRRARPGVRSAAADRQARPAPGATKPPSCGQGRQRQAARAGELAAQQLELQLHARAPGRTPASAAPAPRRRGSGVSAKPPTCSRDDGADQVAVVGRSSRELARPIAATAAIGSTRPAPIPSAGSRASAVASPTRLTRAACEAERPGLPSRRARAMSARRCPSRRATSPIRSSTGSAPEFADPVQPAEFPADHPALSATTARRRRSGWRR